MSKLSGNVKQLCGYLNQVFPGGALFLVATEAELKRLLMELTGGLLQSDECRHVSAARMIGLNSFTDGEIVCGCSLQRSSLPRMEQLNSQ